MTNQISDRPLNGVDTKSLVKITEAQEYFAISAFATGAFNLSTCLRTFAGTVLLPPTRTDEERLRLAAEQMNLSLDTSLMFCSVEPNQLLAPDEKGSFCARIAVLGADQRSRSNSRLYYLVGAESPPAESIPIRLPGGKLTRERIFCDMLGVHSATHADARRHFLLDRHRVGRRTEKERRRWHEPDPQEVGLRTRAGVRPRTGARRHHAPGSSPMVEPGRARAFGLPRACQVPRMLLDLEPRRGHFARTTFPPPSSAALPFGRDLAQPVARPAERSPGTSVTHTPSTTPSVRESGRRSSGAGRAVPPETCGRYAASLPGGPRTGAALPPTAG
mgnify:CR=1 FL=1